jgi:hypothetical protein
MPFNNPLTRRCPRFCSHVLSVVFAEQGFNVSCVLLCGKLVEITVQIRHLPERERERERREKEREREREREREKVRERERGERKKERE